MSTGFNKGAQTPLMEYSNAMMCILYGTEGSPSHMITGSRGVVSHTMELFSLDVSYNSAESDSTFRKKNPIRSAFQ